MLMFLLRQTICSDLSCCGWTARTCGERSSIALHVVHRHLLRDVRAARRPATMRCASICSTVVPSRAMRSCTDCCAPSPSATIGDHGGDADDDAEHREKRAQHVRAQRRQRDPEDFETHAATASYCGLSFFAAALASAAASFFSSAGVSCEKRDDLAGDRAHRPLRRCRTCPATLMSYE